MFKNYRLFASSCSFFPVLWCFVYSLSLSWWESNLIAKKCAFKRFKCCLYSLKQFFVPHSLIYFQRCTDELCFVVTFVSKAYFLVHVYSLSSFGYIKHFILDNNFICFQWWLSVTLYFEDFLVTVFTLRSFMILLLLLVCVCSGTPLKKRRCLWHVHVMLFKRDDNMLTNQTNYNILSCLPLQSSSKASIAYKTRCQVINNGGKSPCTTFFL